MKVCARCPKLIGDKKVSGLCRTCYWREYQRRKYVQKYGTTTKAGELRSFLNGQEGLRGRPLKRPIVQNGPLNLPEPLTDHREDVITICGFCNRPKADHAEGCEWFAAETGRIRPSPVPRRAEMITDYRCERYHEFTSNLVLEEAKCPFCYSKAKETIT